MQTHAGMIDLGATSALRFSRRYACRMSNAYLEMPKRGLLMVRERQSWRYLSIQPPNEVSPRWQHDIKCEMEMATEGVHWQVLVASLVFNLTELFMHSAGLGA